MKKKSLGKKFGNNLINQLYKIDGVISVTIVGSFSKTYDLDKIGDLDVVVICKKITNKILRISKKKIKKLQFKYPNINKKLKINDTFGPVKYDTIKNLIVHLMIYDVEGHIDHVIKSPFTCFDWQRSSWYKGKKLKKIYPIQNIYLRDFFEARRGFNEYISDLKNNNISIRKYKINKENVTIKKINYKINSKNKGEFTFHIIYNLINNYNKFDKNKNIQVPQNNFNKLFLKITKNDKELLSKFLKLKKEKRNLKTSYGAEYQSLAEQFLRYFNLFIKEIKNKYAKIIFLRHGKTSLNDKTFLGQGRNPNIILNRKIKKKLKENFDLIFSSSLKRSISTAKLFKSKKLIINKNLNEINYGKAEGMTLEKYSKKFPEKIHLWKNSIDTRFPKGENTKDVKKRVFKFIKKALNKKINDVDKVLVVTHNVFLRCLIGHFLKIDFKNYFRLNIPHMKNFNFIFKNNNIYPNFKRKDLKKILYKLYD